MTDTPSSNPAHQDHLLVRAARGENVERTPVWAMRQAGRWDPEFMKVREGLSFFEFSENVELATKATLLPRRFGVDGIILFYDITTLPFSMGLPFTLQPNLGPVPDKPIRTLADVQRLSDHPDPSTFQHIIDLLRCVKAELSGELPILVFAGAPFTVGTYCIGTGKDLDATRQFIEDQPHAWHELMYRLSRATIHFLDVLIDEGANVYQLFDSWAGALDAEEYDRWALPFHQEIFNSEQKAPSILFVKECPYLEKLVMSGANVISLGKCHDLRMARETYPYLAFQGNVDDELMRSGTPEQVYEATRHCLEQGGGHRHILNLSHGMNRESPVANFEAYIRAAKD